MTLAMGACSPVPGWTGPHPCVAGAATKGAQSVVSRAWLTALRMCWLSEASRPLWSWGQRPEEVLLPASPASPAHRRPSSDWPSLSPDPDAPGLPSGCLARYPFLEVCPPLVVLADHDLDAAFPVLAFRGDGLQQRPRKGVAWRAGCRQPAASSSSGEPVPGVPCWFPRGLWDSMRAQGREDAIPGTPQMRFLAGTGSQKK